MALSLRKPQVLEPEGPAPAIRPRLVKGAVQRERASRWWRRPRAVYTVVTMAGAGLVTAGVALVFVPAALVLAGLAVGGLGVIGLGLTVRGVQV